MQFPANLKQSSRLKFAVALSVLFLSACSGGASDTASSDETSTNAAIANPNGGSTTSLESAVNNDVVLDEGVSGATESGATGESEGNTGAIPDIDPTPIVRAPADAEMLMSETLELNGMVTLSGMPIDLPTYQWKKNFGPGWANFNDSQSASTRIMFDQAGTYELQLTANNGPYSASDTMQVIVISDVVNQAPVVNVGSDETLMIGEVLTLVAQVDDDGLPIGSFSSQWSKVSGPGEVFFGETSAASTNVTFSASGLYVLRFTSDDGELSGTDSINVSVEDAPPSTPPVVPSGNNINASNNWQIVTTTNGSKPQARHEAGAVAFNGQLYLMGGRAKRQVNRYDASNNRWEDLGTPSLEISHFQPVVYDNKIYVIGSLDCCYPSESVVPSIQIFNPATNSWSQGATLPQNRRRGSAGTVVYNNKIYLVGGSTNGHDGGMVNWFDEYNPANDSWKTLPSAPNQRDHFSAAMVGNKLVAAGGRRTDYPQTFFNLVSAVDIYDFSTGKWESGTPIKTKRAGAMTVSYGEEVVLIGGESDRGVPALSTVEAYNVRTNQWRTLDSLGTARHSGGAAIIDGAIHVVSGNTTTGGGNETQSHERLLLK